MALLTTFANAVGSIPLSQLDSNFANVNSNATFAITAGNVSGNVQANITQLGNLINLTVLGNTTSTAVIANTITGVSILVSGNANTDTINVANTVNTSRLSVASNAQIVGNLSANTMSTNALTVLGSTSTGNLTQSGLGFISLNTITNTSENANINLSTSTSYNLIINNVSSNIIIVPPVGATNGQVLSFTLGGNSSTNLIPFDGTWVPPFAGSAVPGDAYKYVSFDSIWYKLA
jgi:hypothetical protein